MTLNWRVSSEASSSVSLHRSWSVPSVFGNASCVGPRLGRVEAFGADFGAGPVVGAFVGAGATSAVGADVAPRYGGRA